MSCPNDCTPPDRFPRTIHNRPGLPHIAYRIGAYADVREALLHGLDAHPTLRAWTHRAPDDPGIALLEGAAVLADILTFYQEVYANQAYLRTATWDERIDDLVRLIGYRRAPGVGGHAAFAFTVRGDLPIDIPAGLPVKAQLDGFDDTAFFETTAALTAYPALGAFALYRPLHQPDLAAETTELWIESAEPGTTLDAFRPGDRLLIGTRFPPSSPDRLVRDEIVVVDKVRTRHGRTLCTIKGRLRSVVGSAEVAGFRLGRTFRHFGHNAPPKVVSIGSDGSASETSVSYARSLDVTISNPALGPLEMPLDVEVDDLALGRPMIFRLSHPGRDGTTYRLTLLRTVEAVRPRSMSWGALTGRSSVVELDQSLSTLVDPTADPFGSDISPVTQTDMRDLSILETTGPRLRVRAAPHDGSAAQGNTLYFFGNAEAAAALDGRRLLLAPPEAESFEAVVTDVAAASSGGPDRYAVTLDRDVAYADFPNEEDRTTVYGNVAEADQGRSEREAVLGSGDRRQAFQTFKLPKAPLTYHLSESATPPQIPELEIWVEERLWTAVSSFFGQPSDAEVYIVRERPDGDSYVQFGDGKAGRRLPTGRDNVVARYRTGIGAYGPIKPGTKAQSGRRLDGLDKVFLPGLASGGAQAENGANAAAAAPGKTQSLGRLVSLQDYERETLALPGVARAQARWGIEDNVPAVTLTVLMDTGRADEIDALRTLVADTDRCRGPNRHPVRVVQGFRAWVAVQAAVAYDPALRRETVEAAIHNALGGPEGLLNPMRRRFGEREYATRIAGAIQQVDGVQWTRVTGLVSLGPSDDPGTLPFPVGTFFNAVVPCAAHHVLALHPGHLALTPVAQPESEACDG